MLCQSCKTEVSPSKFCSNCGAALASTETKARAEVTPDWLKEVYVGLDYQVGEITRNENGMSSFFGKHKENPNIIVELRPSLRILLVTSQWTIKSPGMLERGEFFKALNSMNLDTICCQCSVPESLDALYVAVTFFVTDVVSRLDIIAFNEVSISLTRRVLNQPRVRKILA